GRGRRRRPRSRHRSTAGAACCGPAGVIYHVMHLAVGVVYSLLAGSRWASSRLSVFVPPRAVSAADQAMITVPRTRSAVLARGTDALSFLFLTCSRVCDGPSPPHRHSAPAARRGGTTAAAPHRS